MKILIDWLSVSFDYDYVGELYEILGLQEVTTQPMRNRYYQYGDYFDGVLIAYNKDEDGNVVNTFLDVSGRGCRTIEQLSDLTFDWFGFLYSLDEKIKLRKVHISRIDVACDLEDYEIPFERFYKYSYHEAYVCKSKVLPKIVFKREEEIYFGSSKSDRLLRIYNKAMEQGLPDQYWMRMEFQLRNDCAVSFYLNWVLYKDAGIGYLYRGMMLDYLRFVDPGKLDIKTVKLHNNVRRLPTAKWWSDLLGDAEKIKQVYLPGKEYTLERLERYAEGNIVSTLKTYAIAHDGDLTKLVKAVEGCRLNNKQRMLLAQLESAKIQPKETEY